MAGGSGLIGRSRRSRAEQRAVERHELQAMELRARITQRWTQNRAGTRAALRAAEQLAITTPAVIVVVAMGLLVAVVAGASGAVPLAASVTAVVQHLPQDTDMGEDPLAAMGDDVAREGTR